MATQSWRRVRILFGTSLKLPGRVLILSPETSYLTRGVGQTKSHALAASQHRHQLRRALRGSGFPEATIRSKQIAQHLRPTALMPTPSVAVRPTEEGSTPKSIAMTRPVIVGCPSRA